MALKAYQTVLEYRTGSSGAYTPVARVRSIKPPKMSAKDIDTTTLESPDEFDESLAGLGNGGEMETTVEYEKARAATLYALFRVEATYRIRYTDGSGWSMPARINEFGDEEIVNGEIVTTTMKVKVTGKPVHAATLP
jgi:hypothetical protein